MTAQSNREGSEPDQDSRYCPAFHRAVELLGKRWSGAIVRAMLHGATRWSEILEAVPGLSDRLLCERLRELEAEDILRRLETPSAPQVRYVLTEKGQALAPVISSIEQWAARFAREQPS
jgi:DNA-binding HxlR family transcriptional regulator